MQVCLDADAVRRWCTAGLAGLRRHQREIDELNVFPVPDGDTGTNLVLTLSAAHDRLSGDADGDLAATMLAFARGALLGARGNSGVIVSQLLAGLAGAFGPPVDGSAVAGRVLAAALTDATDAAYRSVADPVEGTMLSVARGAARAAHAAGSDDLVHVARAAAGGASEALARTPDQLPALARAGVVDAGGRGLVVLLDALVEALTGEAPAIVPAPTPTPGREVARETGSTAYAYEVQFLVDAAESAMDRLGATLSGLGDSLVIVGAGQMGAVDPAGVPVPTWNVHVHVNEVGAAIEAGVEAGRPHRISVTRFADQAAARDAAAGDAAARDMPAVTVHEPAAVGSGGPEQARAESSPVTGPASGAAGVPAGTGSGVAAAGTAAGSSATGVGRPASFAEDVRATVVVATGDGLASLFAADGAAIVAGPNPSTAEILATIRDTGAGRVVILPDVASTQSTAAAAAREARAMGIRASIVPTRSPVQALAALAVRDAGRRFEDDVIAMAEAAGACRYAEVTLASREALTMVGHCEAGDVLALVEGEVNLIGKDLPDTCRDLLDRMLAGGGELVTLLSGAGAPEGLADLVAAHLAKAWPFVEVQTFHGGQPHYPLLVGVE